MFADRVEADEAHGPRSPSCSINTNTIQGCTDWGITKLQHKMTSTLHAALRAAYLSIFLRQPSRSRTWDQRQPYIVWAADKITLGCFSVMLSLVFVCRKTEARSHCTSEQDDLSHIF